MAVAEKIKRKIKEKIRSNDKLYVLFKCVRNLNDSQLPRLLKGYYEAKSYNYTTFFAERCGIKNQGKVVYYIEEFKGNGASDTERSLVGFYGVLRATLEKLYLADYFHFTPVVYWGKKATYYDTGMDSTTTNVFEYYFEPVSSVPYEEVDSSEIKIEATSSHRAFSMVHAVVGGTYGLDQDELGRLAYIYRKYIRLNKSTKEYMTENLRKIFTKEKGVESVLGVHVRGTDYNIALDLHPIIVSAEEFLSKAKELFANGQYSKVFLATDDLNALRLFEEEFQDRLVCYSDVARVSGNVGVHNTPIDRPLHYYKLGLEVIRDVYTLANCDSLVCGLSQVAFAARYVNTALGRTYQELVILDHGIHTENSKETEDCLRVERER